MPLSPPPPVNLANISLVLVEPQGSLNIGAIARVMLNFGVHELRLVNPRAAHLNEEARRMAVNARPILDQAICYDSLAAALADTHYAMATTRRFGKYRENFLHPQEAARHLLPLTAEGKTALVFGREDSGLETGELDLCQRLITIPTAEELPSLNLAQAVGVCLYEVCQAHKVLHLPPRSRKLATGVELEAMYNHMRQTLVAIDYLNGQNPEHILRAFRRLFGRAELDPREVKVLQGLWSRIDWLAGQGEKTPKA